MFFPLWSVWLVWVLVASGLVRFAWYATDCSNILEERGDAVRSVRAGMSALVVLVIVVLVTVMLTNFTWPPVPGM